MAGNGTFLIFMCGLFTTGASTMFGQLVSESSGQSVKNQDRLSESILFNVGPRNIEPVPISPGTEKYPWHSAIVTTVFWIGESPAGNNPIPNRSSAWDSNWARNFGGSDNPEVRERIGFIPARFIPRQNPFYVALPFNDVSGGRTKPEASKIIPWFHEAFEKSGQSVLKGRWVAIRNGDRICYAQWEDVGPFRSDHWEYVFGSDRPRRNLNRGAGLDVSPAVRDFLQLGSSGLTDWRFVDFQEVPSGPWALYGDNNTFVIERRKQERPFAKEQSSFPVPGMTESR